MATKSNRESGTSLSDLKREILKEIKTELIEELQTMRDIITKDVMDSARTMIMKEIDILKKAQGSNDLKKDILGDVEKKITQMTGQMNNQLVVSNNKQLTATKQVAKDIARVVKREVIEEINTTLVPKINSMQEWLNYNTQDTGELINDYRMAVEHSSRMDDLKTITTGKGEDRRAWGPNNSVRVMFGEDTTNI